MKHKKNVVSCQSARDLSSEYGVSEVTIHKWIKKLNLVELNDGTTVTLEDFAKLQNGIIYR